MSRCRRRAPRRRAAWAAPCRRAVPGRPARAPSAPACASSNPCAGPVFQLVAHLVRALVALVRIALERAHHHAVQRRFDGRVAGGRPRDRHPLHQLQRVEVGVTDEQPLPRQQLVQDDAQREQVGPCVRPRPFQQLGRQVRHLSAHHPGVALMKAQRLGRARQPEIQDLHHAVPRHHDVGRRDVTVDDVQRLAVGVRQRVREVEPAADLPAHLRHERRRQLLAGPLHAPPEQPRHVDPSTGSITR